MAKIHINSFLGNDDPLETNTLPDDLESCAAKYENMAEQYRHMARYMREKQIKIIEASGHAYCGTFTVDDIDTQRLKESGHVVDIDDQPTAHNPLFSIDAEFDRILDDMDSKPMWNDIADKIQESEVQHGEDQKETSTYDLANMLIKQTPDFEESGPGAINLEVTKVAEGHYLFNLHIQDLGEDPTTVAFNRRTGEFHYDCGSCNTTHVQNIKSVYGSLKTASALLSNFVYMIKGSKEFGLAITAIDEDLRLLRHLVAFDYGVDENTT